METNTQVHNKLFEILIEKDEITWQTMIYDLVKSEEMNPWDINISLISQRFFEMIGMMKEMDLRVSGKIILAAAIMLRLKSNRLVGEDIEQLDRLFAQTEDDESEEGLLDEIVDEYKGERDVLEKVDLIPRTPQPRKRKVSIYDLVGALQKAMEVKKRRVVRDIPAIELNVPERKVNITKTITNLFGKIKIFFLKSNNKKLTFKQLVPDETKQSKIYTFIPLLHLTNQRKIDLHQDRHFGEIEVELMKTKQEVEKELAS